MTRGELAGRTGCNPETIRYYERIGLMPDPGRSAGGYRQYDPPHERRLRFIMRGRELGFSIEDLGGLLGLVDRRAVTCAEVKSIARANLQAVRKKIADLDRLERVLAATVKSCSGEDVPDCPLIDTLFRDARAR
jgi:MerR family mercuric resistance operon transcriptional regulator